MAIWPPSRWWRDEPNEARRSATPGPATEEHVERAPARPTGDWSLLAPIQRTVGPAPTTFRSTTVRDIMPSHHNPSFTGPLGHSVSAGAPSGTVAGLATTIAPITSAVPMDGGQVDLTLRAPRRSGESVDVPSPTRWLPSVEPILESVQRAAVSPVVAPQPEAARPLAGGGPPPGRPAPAARVDRADPIAQEPMAPVDEPALVTEAAGTTGAPEVPLIGGAEPWSRSEGVEGLEGPPLAPVQRAASGRSPAQPLHLEPPIQPLAVRRLAGSAVPPNRPAAFVERPTTAEETSIPADVGPLGPSPVMGATSPSSQAGSSMPESPQAESTVLSAVEAAGKRPGEPATGSAALPTAPHLPLQRAAVARPAEPTRPEPAGREKGTRLGLGAPLPPVERGTDLPLVAPPAVPTTSVVPPAATPQVDVPAPAPVRDEHVPRLHSSDVVAPADSPEQTAPALPVLDPPQLDAGTPYTGGSTAGPFALSTPATVRATVPVQRETSLGGVSMAPPIGGGGTALQTVGAPHADPRFDSVREGEHPLLGLRSSPVQAARTTTPALTPAETVQRSAFGGTAAPPTLSLAAPPASKPENPWAGWTDAGQAAIDAGVAQRDADGSVVFDPSAARDPEPQSLGQDHHIQRAVVGDAPVSATPSPAAGAGAATGVTGADGNLDEMANQLYDRIRWKLRAELRREMDRAGRGAGF